ncbi:MAG: Iron-sulfur flavoprotein [Methanosaeta sp. PtaB.Bin039]|nr:MAG: Iron-sulfur flavoprotein [Methanosaeta sp. PtaB.Bin039]HOT08004.1 flavodoxin family protein [Methanotrichaceae archaeon]HQF15850.1 flavodoxin family protein [Methanotrichaceae archaeon]HQI90474.1 flavodoxin family protein [Methanotrichaceae archaeon]HQJ28137.1 flavodoxin family protein [Methanotrichaceae archaeon]
MKILGINGSPRGNRSQTMRLMKAALEGAASAGAKVELVDICQLNIKYCTGCGVCYAQGVCVHEDDFSAVYERLVQCDGFIFGSPNYLRSVTAQLKAFLDRMSDAIHCQLLSGKYGCSVATAGSLASAEVTDYLNQQILVFGAYAVGSAGACPNIPGSMEKGLAEAGALGRSIALAIAERRSYPEQEAVHKELEGRFCHLVDMNRDAWPHEYQYWRGKGLI